MIRFLGRLFLLIMFLFQIGALKAANQKEDFEQDFRIVNDPDEFIPGWRGNELRENSSRIFQSNSSGKEGSRCLAVQPISTFDGELTVRLSPADFENPAIKFWARSIRNGSGSRPALVFYGFEESLDSGFSEMVQIGDNSEFANEDQIFRQFKIELPDSLRGFEEIFFRLKIEYGPGTGSAARWLLDDFEFGDFVEDLQPPTLESVRGFGPRTVELGFSEALDAIFSQIQLNYSLDDKEPINASLAFDSLVYLDFEEPLISGQSYVLTIRQIPDLAGNFLRDTTLTFRFEDPTAIGFKDLVINEIMPAPRDGNDLPNVEYVELLYLGDKDIRLGGMNFQNSRSESILEDFWMESGGYLILAPASQAVLLSEYGNVLAVEPWPTLLNSGDKISLLTQNGELIDQISYSTATWGDSELSGGGYSLEVVNPNLLCEQSEFLKPSESPARGTPGTENSVFDLTPDTFAPEFISYSFTDSLSLVLAFSEPIQSTLTIEDFQIEPNLPLDSVGVAGNQILLFFSETIADNQPYQLRLDGVADCSGNQLEETGIEIIRPRTAKIGEVFLNELLFDPRSGGPKFVELYNPTEDYLEIGKWKLANLDDLGQVDQVRTLSEESLVISPDSFLAISTDSERLKMDYPKSANGGFFEIRTLPSYPISGGTVVLIDGQGDIAEKFEYDEELHHPLLRETKGVSLERVSVGSPADFTGNWHSASGNEEYATPGRINSQRIPGEFEAELIQIDPKIFDPEGSQGNTFTTIRYQLDQSGWVGSFKIYDISGRIVSVLAQNEILATQGLYTWTGTDSQGRRLPTGYYVLLVELFDLQGRLRNVKKTIIIAENI